MKKGNITNEAAPRVVVSFDNIVAEDLKEGLLGPVFTINSFSVVKINTVFYGHNVFLSSFITKRFRKEVEEYLYEKTFLNFQGLEYFESAARLLSFLIELDASYVDTDDKMLNTVYPRGHNWDNL